MPSTKSSVSLEPVVSTTTTGNPPISSVNSRTSRVVPRMRITIDAERMTIQGGQINKETAKSLWSFRKLKILLLPALRGPKIAILIPQWTTSRLLSERCFWIWAQYTHHLQNRCEFRLGLNSEWFESKESYTLCECSLQMIFRAMKRKSIASLPTLWKIWTSGVRFDRSSHASPRASTVSTWVR